jgi:cation diffusion facilitator family transporter
MVAELIVGHTTRSLALSADGWHMATHVAALGLAALGYWFARTRARDRAFAFGTGKVHALAGYTSAIVLLLVAAGMFAQSAQRLFQPEAVDFGEALPVACVGLVANLLSIVLLGDADHDAASGHHDHNHRAAYLLVVADAFTSLLAIGALLLGRYLGWRSFDALAGLVGGMVIASWGVGLCRSSGRMLLDVRASGDDEHRIRSVLEGIDDVRIADLHVWETGPGRRSCVVSLVTSMPREARFYRDAILSGAELAHLTVEVTRCAHD